MSELWIGWFGEKNNKLYKKSCTIKVQLFILWFFTQLRMQSIRNKKTTRYAGGSERLYHGEYRHAIMRLFKPKKRKEGKNNGKPNTQSVTHKVDV